MSDRSLFITDVKTNALYEFTTRGIVLADNLSYDDWLAVGQVLQYLGKHIQFAIGDWINYGERKWGEKYTQAIEATGWERHTLINYAAVARRIPTSLRKDNLSFSHHSAVAYLDIDDRDALLDEAQECELSVREIQQNVRALNTSNPNGSTAGRTCPNCGWNLSQRGE